MRCVIGLEYIFHIGWGILSQSAFQIFSHHIFLAESHIEYQWIGLSTYIAELRQCRHRMNMKETVFVLLVFGV
jgi:hypothetical protein